MFNTPTTFILGAGASWHYGYPTGEELVKRVIAKAEQLRQFFQRAASVYSPYLPKHMGADSADPHATRRYSTWSKAATEASDLGLRLSNVNPTLIDFFLKQNADLHEIGKLAIAMVLFDCEREFRARGGNPNHESLHTNRVSRGLAARASIDIKAFNDDWLRFVLYKLASRCRSSSDLPLNKVTFVTFNYDTSLERRLYRGLSGISFFKEEDIQSFFRDRVLHVYGRVNERIDSDWVPPSTQLTPSDDARDLVLGRTVLEACHAASLGLRTIDGPEKEVDGDALDAARSAIRQASKLYILGYGFDETNNARIGLTAEREDDPVGRTVFFTNFGGHNRVSRAATRAIRSVNASWEKPIGNAVFHRRVEMSTKNVYDALNEDFELLETD